MKNSFKKDILIILILFIAIAGIILPKELNDLDEIWNYNFAKNICDGLVPYRDFNMVQMPLLSIICAIFLKVFGNQLIVMRILAVILMTLVFFMAYKVLNLITNDKIAKFVLPVILVLFKDILCIDYNYAVLFIALVVLYTELKYLSKSNEDEFFKYDFKYNFIIGLIVRTINFM